jgi:hypothetical protein
VSTVLSVETRAESTINIVRAKKTPGCDGDYQFQSRSTNLILREASIMTSMSFILYHFYIYFMYVKTILQMWKNSPNGSPCTASIDSTEGSHVNSDKTHKNPSIP